MPHPDFQVISIDVEDVEEGMKDPKLSALRAAGYHTVAVMAVEQRGKTRLAFFMEPPAKALEPTLAAPVVAPAPRDPEPLQARPWVVVPPAAVPVFVVLWVLAMVGLGLALAR